MDSNLIQFEIFLLIVAFLAILTQKFNIPYTVGLVIAGIAVSLMPMPIGLRLSKELLFDLVLPPLIFEATLFLPWKAIKKDLAITIGTATIGLIIAGAVTALGLRLVSGWPIIVCAIFGVLISATDPVAVIASFKNMGVTGRVKYLVETESLFNDGSASVLFAMLISYYNLGEVNYLATIWQFMSTIFGALLVGYLFGSVFVWLLKTTSDHLVEITFTTIAAFSSFLVAEKFHMSGIISTLVCGLVIGNQGFNRVISAKGRASLELFWEYISFIVNSVVFLLIGIQEASQNYLPVLFTCVAAIIITLFGRAVSIYLLMYIFKIFKNPVDIRHQHIMFWGGLRGALALALSLGLPANFPYREQVTIVTFAVVAFSIIIQGLTMPKLITKLKCDSKSE